MKGTWGRRVYGSVRKGPKFTRFVISIELANRVTAYESMYITNKQLELQPRIYGWTLDELTRRLEKRVEERIL